MKKMIEIYSLLSQQDTVSLPDYGFLECDAVYFSGYVPTPPRKLLLLYSWYHKNGGSRHL
jgi:hypothetical protein